MNMVVPPRPLGSPIMPWHVSSRHEVTGVTHICTTASCVTRAGDEVRGRLSQAVIELELKDPLVTIWGASSPNVDIAPFIGLECQS